MNKKLIAIAFISSLTLLSGCFGGGTNPSLPTTNIHTQLTNAGVLQAWPNATIQGHAVKDAPTQWGFICNPNSSGCQTDVAGHSDTSGNFAFSTNAIPADWTLSVQSDGSCASGAGWAGNLTTLGQTLTCGMVNNAGFVTASPAGCHTIYDQLQQTTTSDCPSTITITAKVSVFPTANSLSVATYDESGASIGTQALNASTATSFVMPIPPVYGYSAIIVRDSATNNIIAATAFSNIYKVIDKCSGPGEPSC